MQFIKPSHIQRLLKLKTPEDIREWREERRANFPTKAKREASNELKRESNGFREFGKFAGQRNQFSRENGQKFNGEHRHNSKFGKNGKFGRGNNRFNNGRPSGNKRPFDHGRNQQGASSNEPNRKEARMTGASELSESNEQDNDVQNKSDDAVDSGSLEQSSPANDGKASQQTNQQMNEQSNLNQDSRTNNANQQNRFKRRRQPTLLEKMLLTDVKRNEDAIFQCIHLIVDSNFLSDPKNLSNEFA